MANTKDNTIVESKERYVKSLTINEKKGAVTVVTTHQALKLETITTSGGHEIPVGISKEDVDEVTVVRASKEDTFDPYIGVALALAYQMAGSKANFHRLVDRLSGKTKAEERAKRKAAREAMLDKLADEAVKEVIAGTK